MEIKKNKSLDFFQIQEKEAKKFLDFLDHNIFQYCIFAPYKNKKAPRYSVLLNRWGNKPEVLINLDEIEYNKGILCIKINEAGKYKTKALDIQQVKIIWVDIDPNLNSRINYTSSDKLHNSIKDVTFKIKDYLKEIGFDVGMIVDSGSGTHMYLKINVDISNSQKRNEYLDALTNLLNKLSNKFDTNEYSIDKRCKDIGKRVKIPGCPNYKNTQMDPVRISKILYSNMNSDIEKNTKLFKELYYSIEEEEEIDVLEEFKEDYDDSLPLSIGIHKDKRYISRVIIDNKNQNIMALISSDRKIYLSNKNKKNEIKDIFGLQYSNNLMGKAIFKPWSMKSIKEYLSNKNKKVSLKEIYEKILKFNEEHIDHIDSKIHKIISIYIITTYFYDLFDNMGRLFFLAEYESGKSKQSTIMQNLCFNALLVSRMSLAAYIRSANANRGTVLIDDYEDVESEIKKPLNQQIKTQYKKGFKTLVCDENNEPFTMEAYSPLVINNTKGIDPITGSRCIIINMFRSDNKELMRKSINNPEFFNEVRDQLFIASMTKFKDVKKAYLNLNETRISGRDYEVSEALLSVSKVIGEDVYEDIFSFLNENNKLKLIEEDFDNSYEFNALKLIQTYFEDKESIFVESKILAKDVVNVLGLQGKDIHIKVSRALGIAFRRYGNKFEKKVSNGRIIYLIFKKNFNKILKMKGYNKYLKNDNNSSGGEK